MIINIEFVIKKDMDFQGIPYSILENGKERWQGGQNRKFFENDRYEILSQVEYDKKVEAFYDSFCGHWKEITEERYNKMLEILPPLEWKRGGFFVSEAITLDIYSFFQEEIGRYFEAYFRISTPRDAILKSLYEFIKSNEKPENLS